MLADPDQTLDLYDYFSLELKKVYSREDWEAAVSESSFSITACQLLGSVDESGDWAKQEMQLTTSDEEGYLFRTVLFKEDEMWKIFGTVGIL